VVRRGVVSEALIRSFDCADVRDRNLKILAVLNRPTDNKAGWGAHMEILVVTAFVATAALAKWIYERQMDVLHGHYIEGRERADHLAQIVAPARAAIDPFVARLAWQARNAIYLASLA
jgi:hypothetical protein